MALCVEFERLSDSHGGPDLLSVGALSTFWECRICFFAFSVPDTHEVRFKTGHLVARAFERPETSLDMAEGVGDETASANRSTVFISCDSQHAVFANTVVGALMNLPEPATLAT